MQVADAKGKASAINGKLLYRGPPPPPTSRWTRSIASRGGGKGPHRRRRRDGPHVPPARAVGPVAARRDRDGVDAAEPPRDARRLRDESLGLAAVRLFKDGAWRLAVVDDQMPCHGKLKLAHSSNAEPRDGPVAVVSKALAKLYGCYEHLEAGRVGAALRTSPAATTTSSTCATA